MDSAIGATSYPGSSSLLPALSVAGSEDQDPGYEVGAIGATGGGQAAAIVKTSKRVRAHA